MPLDAARSGRAAAGIEFDRRTGEIAGAGLFQVILIHLIAAGARLSACWSYRGFGTICRILRSMLGKQAITVRLNSDAALSFPFADSYWSALLDRTFVYEDDIERFLRASADIPYTFLDCGANCGYWSVLVSSAPFGAKRVVAFEPSSHSFGLLSQNASINSRGFECRKNALGQQSGVAWLTGSKHESMTLAAAPSDPGDEAVPVITLDSMIEQGIVTPQERCVIKLDVEGLEIEAIEGGRHLLRGDTVVICEDHGNDRAHRVSRHLLEQTDLKLFCFDPRSGRYEPLTDVSSLDRIKRFRNRGYNVLATSSAFWEQRILASG
jgi:FkbM family methyltransferase